MSDALFPYYERELLYLRQLTQEFAKQHPGPASRLLLESTGSADPYVERLLESAALVAGHVHAKIDDDYPELSEAFLQVIAPHFLAPIPSASIVQFQLDPARAQMPQGFAIPRGSALSAMSSLGTCRLQTTVAATLWPVKLREARFQPPPFPSTIQAPSGAAAAFKLDLECIGQLNFSQLQLESLRFFLHGEADLATQLYEMLFLHAAQVQFIVPGKPPVVMSAEACLRPAGFEGNEGLLPYPTRTPLGYRLLTEFFTFPAKFHFLDLAGWKRIAGLGQQVEVWIFCKRTSKSLEQSLAADNLRLGCAPVVNLFERQVETITLRPLRHEYRVQPDSAQPDSVEVYSIDRVTSTDPVQNRTSTYQPFHSFQHVGGRDVAGRDDRIFWMARRRPTLRDNGTDVFLSLVDQSYEPRWPRDETLAVVATCTNRDLPLKMAQSKEPIFWTLDLPAPIHGIEALRPLSAPLRPPTRAGGLWRIVAHLTPSYLALTDGAEGREAFQDLLRLYDFADPAAGQQHLAEQTRSTIEGIIGVKSRRILARAPGDTLGGFGRGIEVSLMFDEEKAPAAGLFLFVSVLERFLPHFATANSFTQLVARTKRGPYKTWKPRVGAGPLA